MEAYVLANIPNPPFHSLVSFISVDHFRSVGASKDGTFFSPRHIQAYERYEVVPIEGKTNKFMLKSFHNTYVAAKDDEKTMHLVENISNNDCEFTFERVTIYEHGHVYLRTVHGTYFALNENDEIMQSKEVGHSRLLLLIHGLDGNISPFDIGDFKKRSDELLKKEQMLEEEKKRIRRSSFLPPAFLIFNNLNL